MISYPNSAILYSNVLSAINGMRCSNFEIRCKTLVYNGGSGDFEVVDQKVHPMPGDANDKYELKLIEKESGVKVNFSAGLMEFDFDEY